MEKIIEESCLAAVSDNDLIQNIQETGDNEAYIELRSRYEKAYYSMCHKYLRACSSLGLKEEDILGNMDFVMFNSARSFDFSRKLKFSTWISNQARYFCLNSMRRGKRQMDNFDTSLNTTETDEEISHHLDNEMFKTFREVNDNDISHVTHIVKKIKDKRAAEVIKLRYQDRRKMSWDKISSRLNISYNLCKSLHDSAIENFRNEMNISPRLTVS